MKRILVVLGLMSILLVAPASAAVADGTQQRAAADTAVNQILNHGYDSGSGLFSDSCTGTHAAEKGNCWWWAADTFMALIDYAENNAGTTDTTRQNYIDKIKADLLNTYNLWCDGGCPGPNNSNSTATSPFSNNWYDDMGWWEQTWINGYELTNKTEYLNLAEQLWNNITRNGGFQSDCDLIIQETADSNGTEDGYANSLYIRNSAWLYEITRDDQYMKGVTVGPLTFGGALQVAASVRQDLVDKIKGGALGDPSAVFVIAGRAGSAPGCGPLGNQSWLTAQGEMVNAWADLSVADATYCGAHPNCTDNSNYYANLADELAESIINNGPTAYTGLAEPTVDGIGILSEPCEPPNQSSWPSGCELQPGDPNKVGTTNSYAPFLIFKGNFTRGAFCAYHQFADLTLKGWLATNANHIAMLTNQGFRWDDDTYNQDSGVTDFATRASILDGLEAAIGGSQAMCAGG